MCVVASPRLENDGEIYRELLPPSLSSSLIVILNPLGRFRSAFKSLCPFAERFFSRFFFRVTLERPGNVLRSNTALPELAVRNQIEN